MPNEAQKTPKIAPRGSLTMRISPKAGQGKSPVPRASKKVFSYRRRETFRRPSTFRLPSAHPQQQQLHRKVVSHQNIFFFWLECRTVFGSPFGLPLVDPNKNQEKIFSYKMTKHSTGESCCKLYSLLVSKVFFSLKKFNFFF